MSNEQTERNWAIWRAYCLSERTLADVGAEYGVAASRIGDIRKKLTKRVERAMIAPLKNYAGRFVAATLDTVSLIFAIDNEQATHRNRPWNFTTRQLYNPWTGVPIAEAAKYFTSGEEVTYCWRIAKPTEAGAVTLTRPESWSAAKPPVKEETTELAFNTPIQQLPLRVRTRNGLLNNGYKTLADVLTIDRNKLNETLKWFNFGRKSYGDLAEFLYSQNGLKTETTELRQLNEQLVKVAQLKGRVAELEGMLKTEYAYIEKLRGILAKMARDYTVDELRKLGVSVEARVKKDVG